MAEENKSDFLDQSEIDKLLAQTAEQTDGKALLVSQDAGSGQMAKVEPFDFRRPAFLSEVELRRLRVLNEDFIRYLSARLSLFLRMEFGAKMSSLNTVLYSKFTESLQNPSHLCLWKPEPLVGVGILDINPRLALTIADRMLGGRGHSVKAERFLTEIETGLVDDVVMIVLEEWCSQWKGEQEELRPKIVEHENNGRFLQTSPKDAVMLHLTMEVNFGDCSEVMQLGVPYYMIEPLVKKMQTRRQRETTYAVAEKQATGAWTEAYAGIVVPIRAEWEACELSLREITHLRIGDVIELPRSLLAQTRLLLNGSPRFVGEVGQDDGRVVVQIKEKIKPS